jgi:hypothetical protein
MPDVLWKELYQAAMLELDLGKLPGRIEAAQAAIREAVEDLAGDHSGRVREEMQALLDAQSNLRILQRAEFQTSVPVANRDRQGVTP